MIGIRPTSSSPRCSQGSARIPSCGPSPSTPCWRRHRPPPSTTLPTATPSCATSAPVIVRKAPVTAGAYYQGLLDRNAIAALFGNNDVRVAHADRTLLSVLSANLQNPAGRRFARGQLHAIGQSGRDFLSLIHSPEQSTITLTSSEAKIPLTFRNDTDQSGPDPHRARERQAPVPRRHRSRRHSSNRGRTRRCASRSRPAARVRFPLADDGHHRGRPADPDLAGHRALLVRERRGRVPHGRRDRVPRALVGLGHPPTAPTPSDGVNDDPTAHLARFDDPQLDAPQFESPQFDSPGFEPRRFAAETRATTRRRSCARARWSRSAPRCHGSPVSCASPRSPTRSVSPRSPARTATRTRHPNIVYELLAGRRAHRDPRSAVRSALRDRTTRTRPPPSSPSRSWCSSPSPSSGILLAPWIVDLYTLRVHGPNRAQQQATRDRPAAAVHAADALLRHRDTRHRDAQRPASLRGRGVRARAQQHRRHRGVPRASSCRQRVTVGRRRARRPGTHPPHGPRHDCRNRGDGPRAAPRAAPRARAPALPPRLPPSGRHHAGTRLRMDRRLRDRQPDRAVRGHRARKRDRRRSVRLRDACTRSSNSRTACSPCRSRPPSRPSSRSSRREEISPRCVRSSRAGCGSPRSSSRPRPRSTSVSRVRSWSRSSNVARSPRTTPSQVADTLAAFSVGLLPFSLYLFALRAFTSRLDTRTPFLINCVENVVNIVLAFPLYAWLGIPGLALAFSLAYFVGVGRRARRAPPRPRRDRRPAAGVHRRAGGDRGRGGGRRHLGDRPRNRLVGNRRGNPDNGGGAWSAGAAVYFGLLVLFRVDELRILATLLPRTRAPRTRV